MATNKELEKRIEELEERIGNFLPMENFPAKEQPKWSADGIALRELGEGTEFYYISSIEQIINSVWDVRTTWQLDRLILGGLFKTHKRAELELDRQKVLYTMRKMACSSRDDNDWRGINNSTMYYLTIIKNVFKTHGVFSFSDFNTPHFNKDIAAQKCLDYLLEDYGEGRLKEIRGVK